MYQLLMETSPVVSMLFAFGVGTIIGSFLNVVIYRIHTGKSLSGNSHCLSCGKALAWYDLFPVVSYIFLRGKCRQCGCRFTARYAAVELLTGILFVAAVFATSNAESLLLLWSMLSVLVVITVYDLRHFIIPDTLTSILTVLVIAYTILPFLLSYQYFVYAENVLAAIVGSGFLFLLWFMSQGQWLGFGDVKLAFPLGLLVGSEYVFSFIVLSFWIGAAVSVALLGLVKVTNMARGKLRLPFVSQSLTIKSEVPFAPFLIAGCLVAFFLKIHVLDLFTV
ncbi:hypothetical protein CL638_02620 [bacterium]|nr:hypothetical protein [bacterium]